MDTWLIHLSPASLPYLNARSFRVIFCVAFYLNNLKQCLVGDWLKTGGQGKTRERKDGREG